MFNIFNNLKLRGRILWGFSVPIFLSVGVAGLVYVNANEVKKQYQLVEDAHLILDDTKDMAFDIAQMQKTARGYMLAKNDVSSKEYEEEKQDFEAKALILKDLIKDREQQQTLSNIVALGNQVDIYNSRLISLVDEGKTNQAIEIWRTGEGRKLGQDLEKLLLDFENAENKTLLVREKAQFAALDGLNRLVVLATFLSAILSIAIGLWIASIISKAVNQTVNMIASSSTEIAATVEEQERTVSQQAASVNQTTTTMDELGASSQQSAEQAEASAAGARQALGLAESGTQAVHETMAGMSTLKEKVGAIAEQIVRLSEQTNQIGNVSDVVGDIANQTNMLALNAAVEAARAGEHGKGFGVVAGEIRKLADQSKKSAEKINTLVTDIQAAISKTVMVTDDGTKNVDEGIKLAQGTAETFTGVADSINNVFLNSQQISLSSKQQAIAIEQVIEAMNAINLGARENASGISQVKSSTQLLTEAAQKLKSVV